MLDILPITGVIFVLIGLGYLSVRIGALAPADMGALGKFVLGFALPALIFQAVSSRPLSEIANPGYLAAVLGGSLFVFVAGYWWVRRSGQSAQASTFQAMGMSCANSGFIGYPVLLMALPSVASTALAMNMIIENLVMIPLVLIMAERSRAATVSGRRLALLIGGRLLRNPIVLALVLGLGVSSLDLTPPVLVDRPVEILANASAALSLAVIGGTLATLPLNALNASVLPVVMGKLLLHPVAVGAGLVAMSAAGLGVGNARLQAAAIILAAMPAMGIYPILAQRFGQERNAALAMFAMTALSFVTISAALHLVLP
ncbi:MAG: putative permease [Limimaricola cinnabarinus]|jgi:predicted permease|uniref:AEC family transporter n=1 Tax=Limimaricola cinnabarinus TaxID=1125964 RepID=UPI0039E28DD9